MDVVSQGSRWKKPNLYATIAGLYFLVVGGLESSIIIWLSSWFYNPFVTNPVHSTMGGSMVGLGLALISIPVLAILVIPSIFAGIKLLKKKRTTYLALATITTSIFFGIYPFLWLVSGILQSRITPSSILVVFLFCIPFGASAIMYIFLIKAHRCIQWKSPSML